MEIEFIGPRHNRRYLVKSYMLVFVLMEVLIFWIFNPFNIWDNSSDRFYFLSISGVLLLIFLGGFYLSYWYDRKNGLFDDKAHILIINNKEILSKELNVCKKVKLNNIKKIKYERDVGRTGSRILIWVNDYDDVIIDGLDINEKLLKMVKKKNIPIIIYPPFLSREDRLKLKKIISNIKDKTNKIEKVG